MATRTTGKRVVHTSAKSWNFPYCMGCLHHVKQAQKARSLLILVIVLSCLFSYGIGATTHSQSVAVILLGLTASGSIFVGNVLRRNAKALCSPNCASVDPAVRYLGWYGQCHSFEVLSTSYAFQFMTTNLNKLVNVDPHVWSWLHQGQPPVAQQTSRRFVR